MEEYLLDLVLTGVEGMGCKVMLTIADHGIVATHMNLPVPRSETLEPACTAHERAGGDRLEPTGKHVSR